LPYSPPSNQACVRYIAKSMRRSIYQTSIAKEKLITHTLDVT